MIARACILLAFVAAIASAQTATTQPTTQPTGLNQVAQNILGRVEDPVGNAQGTLGQDAQATSSWVKWLVLAAVLSLAPALAVMVTSFTRIVVVLGLLRQALATPNLPPNQILFGLALLMSVVVMTPVIQDVYTNAYEPWSAGKVSDADALAAGETAVRGFMIRQLEAGDNTAMVYTFLPKEQTAKEDLSWRDVPTWSLIPAFVLGELKIAFLMGLRIFLPFVIIDMLVGSVLVSMGILMLPPVLIAMPFKLLMFVLADGWALVAGTLMNSFR